MARDFLNACLSCVVKNGGCVPRIVSGTLTWSAMTVLLKAKLAIDFRRSGSSNTALSLTINSAIAGFACLCSRSLIQPLLQALHTTGSLRFNDAVTKVRGVPARLFSVNRNRPVGTIRLIQSLQMCSPVMSAVFGQNAHFLEGFTLPAYQGCCIKQTIPKSPLPGAPGSRPFFGRFVPQVCVRPLDANLGRGRFGPAHRAFSTHDLWPSTPIRSPPLRSPGKHNAGNCPTSSLLGASPVRSDPRLAQQRGEPGVPALGPRPRPCEFNPKSGITSKLRHPRILSLNGLYSDAVRREVL
jgi:hypothetical protein